MIKQIFDGGDVVYHPTYGMGKVAQYPITTDTMYVKYDCFESLARYNRDGTTESTLIPILSFHPWEAPKDQLVRPFVPKYKRGDVIFLNSKNTFGSSLWLVIGEDVDSVYVTSNNLKGAFDEERHSTYIYKNVVNEITVIGNIAELLQNS